MTDRKLNDTFFQKIINLSKEGGLYIWPNENETYTIKGGKMFGKKSAIRKIKNITTSSFHSKLIVK